MGPLESTHNLREFLYLLRQMRGLPGRKIALDHWIYDKDAINNKLDQIIPDSSIRNSRRPLGGSRVECYTEASFSSSDLVILDKISNEFKRIQEECFSSSSPSLEQNPYLRISTGRSPDAPGYYQYPENRATIYAQNFN